MKTLKKLDSIIGSESYLVMDNYNGNVYTIDSVTLNELNRRRTAYNFTVICKLPKQDRRKNA